MTDEKEAQTIDTDDADADAWLEANDISSVPPEAPPVDVPETSAKEGQPGGDRTRDDKGRFTSTPESSDTAQPTESAEAVKPEGYTKAVNALKRAQTPQSVIDSMEPQAVVDWGSSLAKVQAESDGFGKQVSDLKAELAKMAGVEAKAAEPTFDLDKALEPIREYYGDEGAEPIKGVLEQVLKASTPATDPAIAEKLEKLEALQRDRDQRDARRDIQEKHPEYGLDDDARWDRLLASRRGDLDAHRRLLFADEITSDYRSKLKETHAARDAGQPTPPTGPAPPGEMSNDALEDLWLNAKQDGNDAECNRIAALMKTREQTGYLTMDQLMSRVGG
jgi:hypothetical protein